jgi:D-threo-aldose 1-dehydrogenase
MTAPASAPRPTRLAEFGVSTKLAALGLGESRLALGLAGLGGAWGPVDEGESIDTILRALAEGITVFDVAPAYRAAERLLGRALAQWRGPQPVVSTKIGRLSGRDALDEVFDFSPVSMRDSLRASLEVLGLGAVDLLFLHEPDYVPAAERGRVIATLRQLQADGLARRVGVGGGRGRDWGPYAEGGALDVALGFNRLNAVNFLALAEDLPRLRGCGAAYYAASPLAMGALGSSAERWKRELPAGLPPQTWARRERLLRLAAEHGLTLPALAHRFLFGVAEADRVVLGACTAAEFSDALAAWRAGPLPAEVFDAVGEIGAA